MTILRDLSLVYGSAHSLILFLIFFQPRYSKKKFLSLSLPLMIPLMLVNFFLLFTLGFEKMGTLILFTCSLPSMIFFWFMARHRGGRFIFTFCLADTITLELIYATSILDYYLGNTYIFMFISRLLLFPLVEILFYKYLRSTYLNLQEKIQKGWLTFAGISVIFYISLTLSMVHPTVILDRPEYIPSFILILILMPLLYLHFFRTLGYLQKNHEILEKENILTVQVENMKNRMEEFLQADNKFRMERHNFRHKLQTIAGLMDKKEYQEIYTLLHQYNEDIKDSSLIRYCDHPVVDSALSTYLQRATDKNIAVITKLDFPDVLPTPEAELATVFANAIENAIHACEEMEPHRRHLELKVLSSPCFMLQIRNSFNGDIIFDEKHIPFTGKDDHGFGTKFIVAFCEKYNAYYKFSAENELFQLQIMFHS